MNPSFDIFYTEHKAGKSILRLWRITSTPQFIINSQNIHIYIFIITITNSQVDKDGNLNEADVKKLMADVSAKKPWLAQKQEQITSKCLEEAKNAPSPVGGDDNAEVCAPQPMTFMHCVFKEIQLSCPDEEIKDKKFCARMRERMQKDGGDFMMAPPPPPPENE